jgi:hypothetical protein
VEGAHDVNVERRRERVRTATKNLLTQCEVSGMPCMVGTIELRLACADAPKPELLSRV